MTDTGNPLLAGQPPCVVNVGIDLFAGPPRQQSITVVQVLWEPPPPPAHQRLTLLASLHSPGHHCMPKLGDRMEEPNGDDVD